MDSRETFHGTCRSRVRAWSCKCEAQGCRLGINNSGGSIGEKRLTASPSLVDWLRSSSAGHHFKVSGTVLR